MGKFSYFQGLLVLGVILSLGTTSTEGKGGPFFYCNETHASFEVLDDAERTQLGICDDLDWLVINDVVTDNPMPLGDNCKANFSESIGVLTWKISECEPDIAQNDVDITYTWYARNAEGGPVKRKNACIQLQCTFSRADNITSQMINSTLLKTDLSDLSNSADIALTLKTFDDAARYPDNATTTFIVPDPVYATMCVVDPWVPDTFWVQIRNCWVLDQMVGGTQSYLIIEDGNAVTTDDKSAVVVGPFGPEKQDFEFSSFVWTDPGVANPNESWIFCEVYLCNTAAANCTVEQFPARRRRAIEDENLRHVVTGPIKVIP